MDKIQILLLINSILLAFIGVLFVFIGYFLKDLHKDFKLTIEKVNKLSSEVATRVTLFEALVRIFQRQINGLTGRIKTLEDKIKSPSKQ